MQSLKIIAGGLLINTTVALTLLSTALPALADTRVRGEFEYNLDERTLSEWEISPIFALDKSTELEIPVGQKDGKWQAQVRVAHEVEIDDDFKVEFSVGLEAAENEAIDSFGEIEGSWNL